MRPRRFTHLRQPDYLTKHHPPMPIPIMKAEHHRDNQGGLSVWCPYCVRYHHHGYPEGYRVAHCHNAASPFDKTGYIIAIRPTFVKWRSRKMQGLDP